MTEGRSECTRYNRTKYGCRFEGETFEDWFLTVALPYLRKLEGFKVMTGDNLGSHVTVNVVKEYEKHNIKLILLPPNLTDMLQPLDVAYFRAFKPAWRTVSSLRKWIRQLDVKLLLLLCFPLENVFRLRT